VPAVGGQYESEPRDHGEHREFAVMYKAIAQERHNKIASESKTGQFCTWPGDGSEQGFEADPVVVQCEVIKRRQVLFGAPGGAKAALATYLPPKSPRSARGGSSQQSPMLSQRSVEGAPVVRTGSLQSAGTSMIGLGAGGSAGSNDRDLSSTQLPDGGSGQQQATMGSLQIRLQAMEDCSRRNANQLESQRSFLDETLALRSQQRECAEKTKAESAQRAAAERSKAEEELVPF